MGRIIKEYDAIALRPEDLCGQLDFARIFGRQNRVHLEIGSGKGTFLVHQAQAHPDVDFVGIEWASKYYRYAVDRLGRWGLSNVRIIRTDAVTFLAEHIPLHSIDCLHIYFPDPWPKKRHHKRRLLQQANMGTLIERLKIGGELRIATDHAGYFQQIEAVADTCQDELEPIAFTRPAGAQEGELTGTNFERKYIRDRRTINTLALRKKQA
jgi:tRNA (guanine-N7-)-methyltransferase